MNSRRGVPHWVDFSTELSSDLQSRYSSDLVVASTDSAGKMLFYNPSTGCANGYPASITYNVLCKSKVGVLQFTALAAPAFPDAEVVATYTALVKTDLTLSGFTKSSFSLEAQLAAAQAAPPAAE